MFSFLSFPIFFSVNTPRPQPLLLSPHSAAIEHSKNDQTHLGYVGLQITFQVHDPMLLLLLNGDNPFQIQPLSNRPTVKGPFKVRSLIVTKANFSELRLFDFFRKTTRPKVKLFSFLSKRTFSRANSNVRVEVASEKTPLRRREATRPRMRSLKVGNPQNLR